MGMRWNAWRRHPRVIPDPQAPVAVKLEVPQLPEPVTVFDISEGGIELESAEPLEPSLVGQAVFLKVALPDPPAQLDLRGKIAHVKAYRLGVVFQNVLPRDRASLRRYVELRSQAPSWLDRLRGLLES